MVSPLDSKLLRDLYRLKGQVAAIILVMALGVMLLVMMDGLVNTLEESRRAYYERYRLADAYAPVARAPSSQLEKLKAIPQVTAVEGRIVGDALISLEQEVVPIRAQVVSLPDFSRPRLNDIYIRKGRLPSPDNSREVVLLNSFAKARQLSIGDTLAATMFGKRRDFEVVGLAQSPEFLYTTAPGELIPAEGRFAVFWMTENALSAAYDMEGAFNQALLALSPGANLEHILNRVDVLLRDYGSIGAYGLADQASNHFISEEISGLKASSMAVPPIFLSVAAFLLYIVMGRLVQTEREQIGLLKAFGYTSTEVSSHYFKLVLVIALGAAILGSLFGIAAGHSMARFYQEYFKFPFILFQLDSKVFVQGVFVSVAAASLGGALVLRRIFLLTPAVAMRPPAPGDFSKVGSLPRRISNWLDQPSKMVWRRIRRQPMKIITATLGIALGMALSVAMIGMMIGFDQTLELTFEELDRSDATVSFITPLAEKAVHELKSIYGVLQAEPFRVVPVVFKNGRHQYRGIINGLTNTAELNRALGKNHKRIELQKGGLVLSQTIARILELKPSQDVTVEVRTGRRPTIDIPVTGMAQSLLGTPAYMEMKTLNQYLNEQGRISGAFLSLDEDAQAQVYKEIKSMPKVAGLSIKRQSKQAFEVLMDSGAGAMRYVMALIAGVISFGIVYNSARIAYSERERDLASLRVLGFTKGEAGFVLLAELAVITLLALPLGGLLGFYLSYLVAAGFSTDIYQIPVNYSPKAVGIASIAVLMATGLSAWLVKRDVDKLDLVLALKSHE